MLTFLNTQIIALSAGANKLSKIQERAEEYAALIMEELDPKNVGYIEVKFLINFFFIKIQFLIKLKFVTLPTTSGSTFIDLGHPPTSPTWN